MEQPPAGPGERFAAEIHWQPELEPAWDDPRRYGGYVEGHYVAEEDWVPPARPSLLLGTWEDRTRRLGVRIWVSRAQWEGPPTAEVPSFQAVILRGNRTQQVFEDRESLARLMGEVARAIGQVSRSLR